MKKRVHAVLIVLSFLASLSLSYPAAAKMYKFVDDQGGAHFVGSLREVPERYRDRAEEVGGSVQIEDSRGNRREYKGGGSKTGLSRFSVDGIEGIEGILTLQNFDTPQSPAGILLFELVRTRLVFTFVLGFFFLLLLLITIILAKDLTTWEDKRKLMTRLLVSGVLTLLFMWLAIAGPETKRFLAECQRDADFVLNLGEEELTVSKRENLFAFRQNCQSWENALDWVIINVDDGEA